MDPQKKWGSQGFGSREEEYAIAWLLHSKVSLDAMLSQDRRVYQSVTLIGVVVGVPVR